MTGFLEKRCCSLALMALACFASAQTNTAPRIVTPPPPRINQSPPPKVSPAHASGSNSTYHPANQHPSSGVSRQHPTGGSSVPAGQGSIHHMPGQAAGGLSEGSSRTSSLYGTHPTTITPHPGYSSPSGHNASYPSALPGPESRATLEHLNQLRAHLSGRDNHPLPPGKVQAGPNGRSTLVTGDGRRFEIRTDGTVAAYHAQDRSATFFSNGRVRSLHTPAIDVRTGAHGERTVVWRRPDRSLLVRTGRHIGYLQRPVTLPGDRQIIQRTYVVNGVTFTRVYEPYNYHGVVLLNYVPDAYYPPGMYGWVYYPWRPVAITFIQPNAQWYAANRTYFAPAPVYNSGYSWLTDFDIAGVLEKCFDRPSSDEAGDPQTAAAPQMAATEPPATENRLAADADTPITPELKDAIADQIRDQLAKANAAASGSAPDPSQTQIAASLQLEHVFLVSSSIDVNAGEDQSCSLSGGDVLQLRALPEKDGTTAQAEVKSSHRQDCPAGQMVEVAVHDLQEMQNEMRAEMDAGLRKLRENQGRDGWPKAPASALAEQPRAALQGLPDPDPTASQLVEAEPREVAEAEASVTATAFGSRSN